MGAAALSVANAQDTVVSSGKVVEIHSSRSPHPSVIPLGYQQQGFWASGFPRLKNWKPPENGDTTQAMDFRARLVGEKAEVTVSLFSGKRFQENTEVVARVSISEGEMIVVSELEKFGFEPITVKMMATSPVIAETPLVSNPSPLLETTVTSLIATVPTFKIKFQNNSSQDIMAFSWHTETDGRPLRTSLPRGKNGRSIISQKASFEMEIKAGRRPGDVNPITFVIDAVMFRDGSIDGNHAGAANYLEFIAGEKRALDQLVPMLLQSFDGGSRPDLSTLIKNIDDLSDGKEITPSGISFDDVVTEALSKLSRLYSESSGKNDVEIVSSLSAITDFYRDWQNRLKK